MSVRILIGDVRAKLAELPADSVDCVVTSPPYWGLRDYGVDGQIGMERTLGEHLAVMVEVFDAVRRVMKPEATLWLNYGDCYATKPNGRSAAATKEAGTDDRTFRDKPFSTVGPIHGELCPDYEKTGRVGRSQNKGNADGRSDARVMAGGLLKPKDLCMVPNRLAIALQDAGWWVRSEIVWGKPNPMPDSSGRYRPSTAHEKLFLLSKSATCFYDSEAVRMPSITGDRSPVSGWAQGDEPHDAIGCNTARASGRPKREKVRRVRTDADRHIGFAGLPEGRPGEPRAQNPAEVRMRIEAKVKAGELPHGRLLRNYEPDLSAIVPPEVWQIATAAFSEAHFATFPPALVAPCILAGCPVGGTVLDPFFGAGTTGLVANRLQRACIGIELNPEYAELARRRIADDAGMFGSICLEAAAATPHTNPASAAA